MSQQRKPFEAEVLFHSPDDVPRAAAAFAMFGFHYEIDPHEIDPCGPTVFGTLTGLTEFDEDELGNRLRDILVPLSGDLVEWGHVRQRVS